VEADRERRIIEIPCECSDPACRDVVVLTRDELDFIRSVPNRAVLSVGHTHQMVERVLVEEPGRFQVLALLGAPEDVVAQLHLRAHVHRRRR
jgi:hypothetical protein